MEKSRFEQYLEASGATDKEADEARARFNELLGKIGDLPSDEGSIAVVEQIRDRLHLNQGFQYNDGVFRAHDVLRTKKANCHGFPMLIASIAAEKGYNLGFRDTINPHDSIFEDEIIVFHSFDDDSRLERTPGNHSLRFSSLEHCVLDVDGRPIETTSPNFGGVKAEVISEPSGFERQLGIIYRDRATTELRKGDVQKARNLLGRAISLAGDYREMFPLMNGLAVETFDDKARTVAIKRYQELGGSDSVFDFNMFNFTGDKKYLGDAIEAYPRFAEAIALEARTFEDENPDEARALFSVASKCFANSMSGNLPGFYAANANYLARLFGKKEVEGIMRGFADECDGDFGYYRAMYHLTSEDKFLRAMRDSAKTPLQELIFLERAKGTRYHDVNHAMALEAQHRGSEIYASIKQELNRKDAL